LPSSLTVAVRIAALSLLLVVAAIYAVTHMDQGIDTWISLAGGRDVVTHGVRDADPFSFNSRRPVTDANAAGPRMSDWLHPGGWINQNWLTHLLLYRLRDLGGLDALVVWKLVNYLLVAVVLALAGRALGAPWTWSALAAATALAVSRAYLSMRAQDVSNLLIALLVLVLAVAGRRSRQWAWALVPLFAVWANAHGGFIYGFIVMAVVLVPDVLRARKAGGVPASERQRLVTLIAATAAAVFVSAALSPYKLANLTHPLVISVSADAPRWRVVREWKPLFSNPVASPWPFVAFAVAAVLVFAARYRFAPSATADRLAATGARVVLVSFLLALTSGRFVPVACITAAPFLATWLDGAGTALARRAGLETAAQKRLASRWVDALLWVAALASVLLVLPRAQRTYLAPWPHDEQRTGLFDRMTFSHQRPWGPCAFLAANGVSGRMWNFWDEGGFLASCQQPDGSGRPPVQIFIDGRAQAAYDVGALQSYLGLLNGDGGAPVSGKDAAPPAELAALRSWTADRLRELGVWIALVPAGHQSTAIARAVVGLPGWKLVYIDPEHGLFVDTGDPLGRALSDRVADGSARYPSAASARLTAAFRLLPPATEADQRRAVDLARESYRARPSGLAVLCAIRAARTAAVRAEALRFCREVAEEFETNRQRHRAADGYALRLDAASTALQQLAADANKNKQADVLRWAAAQLARCRTEQEEIVRTALW